MIEWRGGGGGQYRLDRQSLRSPILTAFPLLSHSFAVGQSLQVSTEPHPPTPIHHSAPTAKSMPRVGSPFEC